jgi:LacI family transcriptional regulator
MAHNIALKEIALQARGGLASVDRVINDRGGVQAQTEQGVRQAIAELAQQCMQPTLGRRRILIDLVMDAPNRFATSVKQAIEAVLPEPAVQALSAAQIPTMTFAGDLAASARIAYTGLDNHAAGETAAYPIASWMGRRKAKVLVTLSSRRFLGEEQRRIGFMEELSRCAPHLTPVRLDKGRGLDRATFALTEAILVAQPGIEAVYSLGGGSQAIHDAFLATRRECRVFVAHDLDTYTTVAY